MKNGKLEVSETSLMDNIANAMQEASDKQTQRMVKESSTAAAQIANAAKSDLSSLRRIIDRLKKGYYHTDLK